MTLNIILAQIIGIISSALNSVSSASTNKKRILFLNAVCNALGGLQYVLLGAYTGCISSVVAIGRNIAFEHYNKKNRKAPVYILIIFLVLAIGLNLPYINSWIAVIPVFNIIAYGYGIWQDNIKIEKELTITVGVTGMIYNLFTKAYTSLISSIIDLVCGGIGFIRSLKEKKSKRRNKKSKKHTKKKVRA